jgi:puromycin-sensitive aminopeptidase
VTVDPYRLPREVLPRRYDLVLEPHLTEARFDGEVRITVTATAPVTEVVLNAAELAVHGVTVAPAGGAPSDAAFTLSPAVERLVVSAALASGDHVIAVRFSGVLNDRLKGFYRSTYLDDEGRTRVVATTQMQPTDCRRAFPCFDEPDLKAVFGVTLVVDEGHTAISNGAEAGRRLLPDGRIAVSFADTIPMSTYLVAFVVGPLEVSAPAVVGGVPIRVVHVPGKAALVPFGLAAAAATFAWFQEYYEIPYPGGKIDLVALPDFAAGAMENLGCITFRESLLLVDPSTATQTEQQVVVDVVAHELAHMWFGDLVTMRWWNGLWLNEAFATFMEIEACDAYRPDWERWTSFSLERTAAFETDSLSSTRTVEYEVRSPADSEGMFDVLTYQKGGALLRMLQQYLGDEVFRDGVRHYLTTHAYGNTDTDDLWDALEHVAQAPVRAIMDSWIWRPGYPLVTARLTAGRLVLEQERFTFDPEAPPTDGTRWSIPVHVRQWTDGAAREDVVLLDGPSTVVELLDSSATVVVNAGGHGFYRVAYDAALRSRLTGAVVAGLSTIERYALVDDAWAAVTAGHLDAAGFLELAASFAQERDYSVWQALATALRSCNRLVEDDALEAFRARVRGLVDPVLDEIGWDPAPGEGDLRAKLRGLLVSLSAVLGRNPDSRDASRSLFERAYAGEALDPDLAAAVTGVTAAFGDDHDYDRFLERFRHGSTPQEQLRYLYALAEFPTAEQMARTCDVAFSGEVKTQNAPFLLARAIANREHGAAAWSVVRSRWAEANERFPSNTIVRMVDTVRLLTDPAVAADVQAFFSEHPIPQAGATLAQVLERQRVNVRLRERERDRLATALGPTP